MRLPRFTLRRLMVAVAIVAVIIWVVMVNDWRRIEIEYRRERYDWRRIEIEDRRRERYESLYRVHMCYAGLFTHGYAFKEKYGTYYRKYVGENCPHHREAMPCIKHRERDRAYHAALVEKYRWASDHPWLPVAPDPPEPE